MNSFDSRIGSPRMFGYFLEGRSQGNRGNRAALFERALGFDSGTEILGGLAMGDNFLTASEKNDPVYKFVVQQMVARVKRPEIERRLVAEKGLDAKAARAFMDKLLNGRQQANYDSSVRNMVIGALCFLGGVGVTVASYSAAAKRPGGGTYVVAAGVIVFGAMLFCVAFVTFLRGAPKKPEGA